MIFGDWLGILFAEFFPEIIYFFLQRNFIFFCGAIARSVPGRASAQVGDFFVQVGEGGFEGFAVIGVGGGIQVVCDAGARELQLLYVLVAGLLLGTFGVASRKRLGAFFGFDLRFYVFAFPASRHRHIF